MSRRGTSASDKEPPQSSPPRHGATKVQLVLRGEVGPGDGGWVVTAHFRLAGAVTLERTRIARIATTSALAKATCSTLSFRPKVSARLSAMEKTPAMATGSRPRMVPTDSSLAQRLLGGGNACVGGGELLAQPIRRGLGMGGLLEHLFELGPDVDRGAVE